MSTDQDQYQSFGAGEDALRALRDREMALALMNQQRFGASPSGHQANLVQATGSLSNQPNAALLDIYNSRAAAAAGYPQQQQQQDPGAAFLSSSSGGAGIGPGNEGHATSGGGGRSQLLYSEALQRMNAGTSGGLGNNAGAPVTVGGMPGGMSGMSFQGMQFPDRNFASSMSLYGGMGVNLPLSSMPMSNAGAGMAANDQEASLAATLRENAMMRERLMAQQGDLQFSSLPYGSFLGAGAQSMLNDRLASSALSNQSSLLGRNRMMMEPAGLQQSTLFNSDETGKFPARLPCLLAVPEDNQKLSNHQVFLRNQIEAFQATEDDLTTHTRGRNKPIKLGQVGIRCLHCARLPVARRQKGSTYFPASLHGLYQAAQNMNTTHMQRGLCTEMPPEYKKMFTEAVNNKVSSSVAGRPYWAKTARQLGLIDTEDGIRFVRDLTPAQITQIKMTQAQDLAQKRANAAALRQQGRIQP